MTPNEPLRLVTETEAPSANEADAGRLFQILWRGKWILLAVPLIAVGAAKYWLDAQTELFVASAKIQVDARQVNVLKSGGGEATNKPRTVLKQQQSLVKSIPILKKVAESPLLADMQTFAPESRGDLTMMGALNEGLSTTIDIDSDNFFISFTSPYREEAEVVVNEALRVYIDYHKEKKREQAEGVASIVRREWEATKQELADTSQAISDLQTANDLAGNERTPLQEKLDNVNRDLHEADKETEKLRAVWNEMTEAHADPARFRERGLYWRSKNPIGILEERQKSLENERESKEAERDRLLLGGLGREHERLAKLRGEIERLRAQEDTIAVQYAEEYLRSSEVEFRRQELLATNLAAEAKTLQAQVMQQSQVLERITDLKITRDQLRGRVAGFDERITQLELENQTGALNLDVIEYGRAGIRPVYPETEKTYIYALGGGGILAFGLVLLFGLSDRRVRDVEEVPRLLGTSVLGVLPELPHGSDRVRLARTVEEDPHSLASEAFRSVRTATTFGLPGGAGIVLVTSANANEGKSVCASNLAFALARAGKRTLLVDGDMRNPGQHENYSVPNGTGLAGLLNSDAPVKNALVPKVALGLDLLPAGDPHGKAAELCEGEVLGELLRSLRNDYECIVIDSPPVLETSEARILAALADAVVFVLRLEVSKAPNLKRAAGILRGVGARILGCLPNGASSRRGARAYAGGISIGHATPKTPTGPREARAAGDEGELGKARAHGTDFLGLKEESA